MRSPARTASCNNCQTQRTAKRFVGHGEVTEKLVVAGELILELRGYCHWLYGDLAGFPNIAVRYAGQTASDQHTRYTHPPEGPHDAPLPPTQKLKVMMQRSATK